jgi:putative acetyltransferase
MSAIYLRFYRAENEAAAIAAHLLIEEAKRISPTHVTLLVNEDNIRAVRFYERNDFGHAGEDVNPTSGRPVLKMVWKG